MGSLLCLFAQLCPTLCNPMVCSLPGSSVHRDSPGKNTGVGCHALLQGVFPNPRVEPKSPTLQADSLPSEPLRKPKNTVAYSFPRNLPNPRIKPGCPALQADSLPAELSGKPIH